MNRATIVNFKGMLLAALVIACASLQSASAGMLSTTVNALNDGLGPAGGAWQGSEAITAFVNDSNEIDATIEYAVFTASGFDQFLTEFSLSASNPTPTDELLYVYQLLDILEATPGVSTLTVGVDSGDPRGTLLPPAFVTTGVANEIAPTGGSDQGTSMRWAFDGQLGAGEVSPLLVFSSPFAPELDTAQASSGLAGPNPSPLVASISDRLFMDNVVPEPSIPALLMTILGVRLASLRRRPGK